MRHFASSNIQTLGLAERIRDLCGCTSDIVYGLLLLVDDPKIRRPDIERARELLQWEPRMGLERG